jgi:hypothetical protein
VIATSNAVFAPSILVPDAVLGGADGVLSPGPAFVESDHHQRTAARLELVDLVAKSLVVADVSETIPRFRLLDTTRGYALKQLRESGKWQTHARWLAVYLRDVMRKAEVEWETRPTLEWRDTYAPQIDNVRAALDWAFSPEGEAMIGVALTTTAVPLFYELRFFEECRVRAERALAVLKQATTEDDRRRMQLVFAHPAPAGASPDRLADITNRTASSTEARLALAVLTTDRKAA